MKHLVTLSAVAMLVLGCSEKELILEGERLDIRADENGVAPVAIAESTMKLGQALPKMTSGTWSQPMGSAARTIVHASLSAQPAPLWSAKIGSGEGRKNRITASPVIAGGRIFAMDANARVTAVNTAGGTIWSTDLTPANERAGDASGGGVVVDGNTVYVTTGFARVHALDASTGAVRWTQKLDASVSAAPTVANGTVYAVSGNNTAWAINAGTGRINWEISGTPSQSGIAGGTGPAVIGSQVILPFSSGEIVSVDGASGARNWGAFISGERKGRAYSSISALSSGPIVAGDTVFAGNGAGRLATINIKTGERGWSIKEGAYGPALPIGNSVYFVSDQAEFLRVERATGAVVWRQSLPLYTEKKVKKRDGTHGHFGPVFAGGRIWIASSDGVLRGMDPVTGATTIEVPLSGGAASAPSVAGGTLYVMSTKGVLHAFR
ncbi:MAG: PQQ-binding-like beta-propeller repeat protein [Halocynthiibacter sp.]